ncbi:kinesin-like protein KIN-10C [Primulina huaijiensis]|uniref:kinesin-like protein KIN-10C n=1 Tax=Primulina huaijiensis TaxID=1492673 RepID=UPI003CC6EE5D
MASTVAGSDNMQSSRSSKPANRVRIVGKIRGFTDQESESLTRERKPWITVQNPHENGQLAKATVSLDTRSTGRKNAYELDHCYEPDEDIGLIYSREIRHMISEVFNGQNASVIALGARGSGKTFTIQGSIEKPGLATIAMSEILSKACESKKTVSVSLYLVTQDHAFDLLDPDCAEVHVLGDTQGKLNLKGLSQVKVKSVSEFENMYFRHLNLQKSQKISMDPRRYHKGLMVHISSEDDNIIPKLENKINLVDLAGYEDPRKSGSDRNTLIENYRSNKSLFALINVINALNSNEIHVPYRESKLTRILQDSLSGTSHVLVFACLNPFFCKDSISSLSFVSRSCHSTKQVLTDSTNKCQSSAKSKMFSSLKSGKTTSTSLIVKKHIGRSQLLSGKKADCILKGRKLFDEENTNNPKQLICLSEDTSSHKNKVLQDHDLVVAPFSLEEDNVLPCAPNDEAVIQEEKDLSTHGLHSQETINESCCDGNDLLLFDDGKSCESNKTSHFDGSVPLSQKIKELSKNLKLLCSSTPMKVKIPEKEIIDSFNSQLSCNDTTPMMKFDGTKNRSPRGGTFSICGSSLKNSLVKEQLNFLNSANKEELKKLRGIGEKRASYILELREESQEPFKSLDDLQNIGMSAKQIKGMMKGVAAELFN